MKKALITLLSLAMVAGLASCQKPTNDTPVTGNVTLTFGMADTGRDTKVTYTEVGDNLRPAWEVGDVIVGQTKDGSANFTLTVKSVSGGSATVTGDAPLDADVCLLYKKGLTTMGSLPITVDYSNQSGDKGMPAVMISDGHIDKDGKGEFKFKCAGSVIGIDNAKGVPAGTAIAKVIVNGSNLSNGSISKSGDSFVLDATPKTGDAISTGTLSGITVGSGDDRKLSSPIFIAIPAGTTTTARVEKVTLFAGGNSYSYTPANTKVAAANSYIFVKDQSFTRDNPEGSLPGKFSVSENKQVYFSKGNLQYVKSGAKWQFASAQYETVETDGQDVGDNYSSASVQSLFGWGDIIPLRTSEESSEYSWPVAGDPWGSKIDNKGTWRTLSQPEWEYLIKHHQSQWAAVAGKTGRIFAPEGYSGTISETYTAAEWTSAEAGGLAFLPSSGSRVKVTAHTSNPLSGEYGAYWSSSDAGYPYAASVFSYSEDILASVTNYDYYSVGLAVRLVSDCK